MMRRASRLRERSVPLGASKMATPTGEVSTSVSRSARARRSSRCVRALAITSAACEANITSVSSSARLNSSPSSRSPTKTCPTRASRWNIGAPMKRKTPTARGMVNPPKPRARTCSARSGMRTGPETPASDSKMRNPSGMAHSAPDSSSASPEERKSCTRPSPSSNVITP